MALYLILFPALLSSLFSLSSQHQQINKDHHLISELQEAKLKIARLESVLEETIQNLDAKIRYVKEREKLIDDMENQIQYLLSALSSIKGDSSEIDERISALQDEVKLLWAALRKSNFDIHVVASKARETEDRLEVTTSEVDKMADIVTEQWIQVQQLEQMKVFNARRQLSPTRCTFLKFINDLSGKHLQKVLGIDFYMIGKKSSLDNYMSQIMQHLKSFWSAFTKYHHELQGYIKREMEKCGLTAAVANKELIFFVASALITFPILGAWMLISSQLS